MANSECNVYNKMFLKVILQLMILCISYAYKNEIRSRMIGGHEASLHYGRFHVSLQNLTGHHVCGGAVVSAYHVVTAAHCVHAAEPQYIKVVVGTTNLDVGGKQYNVTLITVHKNYNYTRRTNDIAIIKVKGPFDMKYVDILPIYKNKLVEEDTVILTGFGAHKPNGESSRLMHELELPVFNQKTCQYAMRYTRNVTDKMFCTFTKIGEGTCHGDSGGPVTKNDQLAGIVSWGIPCAIGFPDVHTRITPYVEWIKKQTKFANCHLIKKKSISRKTVN